MAWRAVWLGLGLGFACQSADPPPETEPPNSPQAPEPQSDDEGDGDEPRARKPITEIITPMLEPAPPPPGPWEGRWVSEMDGAELVLTPTTFVHRFPYEDGTRENRGDIIEHDVDAGTMAIRYTEVLQDGVPVPREDVEVHMTYEIRDGRLYKRVGADAPPDSVGDEPYRRQSADQGDAR